MTIELPDMHPYVDFVILADRAEALNGKLYMMGGGWDRLFVPDFSKPHPLSFAVAVVVPWMATNEEHALTVRLLSGERNEVANVRLNFVASTSPHMRRQESQRVMVAFQIAPILPGPDTYKVSAMVDDAEETGRSTVFYAVPQPAGQIVQ